MTLLSTSLRPDTLENIQEPGGLSVDSIRLILEAERYVWFPWLSYLHPRAPGVTCMFPQERLPPRHYHQ